MSVEDYQVGGARLRQGELCAVIEGHWWNHILYTVIHRALLLSPLTLKAPDLQMDAEFGERDPKYLSKAHGQVQEFPRSYLLLIFGH